MSISSLYKQDSNIEKNADNRWSCEFKSEWCVGKAVNGGFAMSLAARAMAELTEKPHPMVITGYYLDVTEVGPAEIHTDIVRAGRNVSTAEAKLIQNGKERIRFLGSFTDLTKPSGDTYLEESPPELPSPDDCQLLDTTNAPIEIAKRLDTRLPKDYSEKIGEKGNVSELRAWVNIKDEAVTDVFSLCLIADALMPAVFNRVGPVAWVPTLEFTVQIRGIPAPGPLRTRFKSRFLTNGTLEEDGEIWDSSDQLVALSRQTAKLRIPDRKKKK